MNKLVITGSLGNVSQRLAAMLVRKGHQVTVVSHNPQRKKDIEELGATPVIGSILNKAFLTSLFSQADAVYTMVPPDFSLPDYNAFAQAVSTNYAEAIAEAGVKYVVNLSGSGSPLAGIKPLEGYHNLEKDLDAVNGINILHLRPGGFYTNFYGAIGMIKYQDIIGNNFEEQVEVTMSHPEDIALAASQALDKLDFVGHPIKYIVSDKRSGKDIAAVLGRAIGKPDLRWVCFSDTELLEALMKNGIPEQVAQEYLVNAGIALREGILDGHFNSHRYETFGSIKLEEFANEFAYVYQHS